MTDEEKAAEYADKFCRGCNRIHCNINIECFSHESTRLTYLAGLEEGRKESGKDLNVLTKENAELKKEISILLSCANCPENKGGYICEKEYNDQCLAQKIEYIKELKQENAELKAQIEKMKSFIQSEIDFCMYCPLTKTCKNDEGVCPYANVPEEEQKKILIDWIQNKWEEK